MAHDVVALCQPEAYRRLKFEICDSVKVTFVTRARASNRRRAGRSNCFSVAVEACAQSA